MLDADVKVTGKMRIKPRGVTPVRIVSAARGYLRFEPNLALVLLQPQPANGIMEVLPTKLFHMFLPKPSNGHLHVPKHMIVEQLCNNLTTIVDLVQLRSTSIEDASDTISVSIDQSDNENTSSTKGARTMPQTPGVTPSIYQMTMPKTATTTLACFNLLNHCGIDF